MSQTHPTALIGIKGRLRETFHLLWQHKEAAVGSVIVSVFLIIAIIVVLSNLLNIQVTPYPPLQQNVGPVLAPPSTKYWLGTDIFGRDLFSRIIVATPNDVAVGYVVVGSAFLIGSLIGGYAGIKGGSFDDILMRTTDVFFALPVQWR
jgi:peptide/nickel transport system permease protein